VQCYPLVDGSTRRRMHGYARVMPLSDVDGRSYGPATVHLTETLSRQFVAATGDDDARWTNAAPPSFAAALLFAVAPEFLSDPDVVPYTRVLVHSDQRFTWSGPLRHDSVWTVVATVTSVRSRGPMNFVTLEAEATEVGGSSVSSISVFLMGDEAGTGEADERTEPPVLDRATSDSVRVVHLQDGSAVGPIAKSIDRLGLFKYAAVSGDFNPVHLDHDSAVASGLAGTVAHGLLISSWMLQIVSVGATGDAPVRDARIRFKNPLFPAEQATIAGSTKTSPKGLVVSLSTTSNDVTIATCQATIAASG
jgi:3-hydroxybutyryl-CoA dehydratase